jgi:hypothetical protein
MQVAIHYPKIDKENTGVFIPCIKFHRWLTGKGLKETKAIFDELIGSAPILYARTSHTWTEIERELLSGSYVRCDPPIELKERLKLMRMASAS